MNMFALRHLVVGVMKQIKTFSAKKSHTVYLKKKKPTLHSNCQVTDNHDHSSVSRVLVSSTVTVVNIKMLQRRLEAQYTAYDRNT